MVALRLTHTWHYPERASQGDIKSEVKYTPLHEAEAWAEGRGRHQESNWGHVGQGSQHQARGRLWQEEAEGRRVGNRGQWEKIGPIRKYYTAYGKKKKKKNTEPGINRFWIPVLDLLYYELTLENIYLYMLCIKLKEIYYDLYNWYYKWA